MSGTAWLIIDLGFLVLGAAIIYGIVRSRRKTPAEDRAQEQATDRLYKTEPE
jgi:hypothetical protein